MTTEPGVLPKDYEELDYSKMAPQLQTAISTMQIELEHQVLKVESEAEEEKPIAVDFGQSLDKVEATIEKSKSRNEN